MKKGFKKIIKRLDLIAYYRALRHLYTEKKLINTTFQQDWDTFQTISKHSNTRFDNVSLLPLVFDKTDETPFEPHYTYHPAWAARILAKTKPKKHIDISSTLNFCTVISAFIPVVFYDYRPAKLNLNNLESLQGNLLQLPFEDNSVTSLSCMHTIEHVGLGRYGDKLDYDGDLKAIAELKRVLAKNGNLIIVTPIGKSKIEFNAHRIYSYSQIISYFSELQLIEFSLVPDDYVDSGIIINATEKVANEQNWGCGCFWFKK